MRRLSAATAAIVIASAAATGTIATVLPGSPHGAAHGKATTGRVGSSASAVRSGTGTSGSGTSGSASSGSGGSGATSVAPGSSSGGTHATSGGS